MLALLHRFSPPPESLVVTVYQQWPAPGDKEMETRDRSRVSGLPGNRGLSVSSSAVRGGPSTEAFRRAQAWQRGSYTFACFSVVC
jgi:hypothetical protein